MGDKPKFPYRVAMRVAEKIVEAIQPVCARVQIAGSLRRKKAEVGDIEIVYVPCSTRVPDPGDFFGKEISVNATDIIIHELIARGSLAKRANVLGSEIWGERNKFAVAVKTGIPVDLFATPLDAWFNYLVCRTGSAETNIKIAAAAKAKHCKWEPTRPGFSQSLCGEQRMWIMKSEEEVFHFVCLPYRPPEER